MENSGRGLPLGTSVRILHGTYHGLLGFVVGYHAEPDQRDVASGSHGRWGYEIEVSFGKNNPRVKLPVEQVAAVML